MRLDRLTTGRYRPYRRTRMAAAGVLLAGGVTWLAAGQGGAAPAPGQGLAGASTVSVTPRAGSLAVGVTFGEALAGHQNGTAKAQSQAIDLSSIGTSLTGYNCGSQAFKPDQIPQPLIVETGEPGAAQGITQSEEGGAFTKFGLASSSPYGQAVTTTAPFAIAGVLSMGPGVSKSWSGLLNGERQAGASSDIASLTLPGGVSLAGLHWESIVQSTGHPQQTATFTIGKATIGGASLPTNNPTQTLSQINAVLGLVGLQFKAPSAHLTQGILYEDPLELDVVPNSTRDSALNAVLTGIQPIRQQVFAAALQAYCQSDTPITVADVAIAAISGGGSMSISLGGVHASSGSVTANGYDLSLGAPQIGPGGLTAAPSLSSTGDTGTASSPGSAPSDLGSISTSGGTPGTGPSGGATTPLRPQVTAIEPAAAIKGKRGGALAAVGLVGLGLLAGIAEADRRKMRRAQRIVTFEE